MVGTKYTVKHKIIQKNMKKSINNNAKKLVRMSPVGVDLPRPPPN